MRETRDYELTANVSLAALLEPQAELASAEERLLWQCARVTLTDASRAEIQRLGVGLDAAGWAHVATLAERNGVENLLFTQIAAVGLLAALPEPVALRLRERYGAVTLTARRLERRLEALLPLLEQAGASVIPLKGVRLARRAYGGVISLRPVTDIDVLARGDDDTRWRAAFQAAGLAPVAGRGDAQSGHALRFRELQFRDASGLLVEAHLTLCRHPAYRRAFPQAEIWSRAQPARVHGVRALALAEEDELRYLSLHYAAQHQASRLIWLVDVAELLRRRGTAFPWERFVDETIARRIAAPVAITLLRARTLLDAPAPHWACARLKEAALTAAERQAWADSQAPMRNWRRFLAQTLTLDSPVDRLRLLRSGGASLARRLRRSRENGSAPR
ncbi:MAG TPA: nucleotidyltransferase family protein [Ktedonobacterales bacterium]